MSNCKKVDLSCNLNQWRTIIVSSSVAKYNSSWVSYVLLYVLMYLACYVVNFRIIILIEGTEKMNDAIACLPYITMYVVGSIFSGLTYKSHTKWKMLWGIYSAVYGEVNVSVEKCVEMKGRLCWKIAKLFYFCHLKKLVRPETFGPYYVYRCVRCKAGLDFLLSLSFRLPVPFTPFLNL